MKKLEECARAVVPHICRATQDIDFEQDARDFRDAKEIVRAVIRCLMEPSEAMMIIGTGEISRADVMLENYDEAVRTYRAMLQSVLEESENAKAI